MAQFTFTSSGASFKLPHLYASVLSCLIRHAALSGIPLMNYATGQNGHPSVSALVEYIDRMPFSDECHGKVRPFINTALINPESAELVKVAMKPRNYKSSFNLDNLNGFMSSHSVEEGIWHAVSDPTIVTAVLSNDPTLTISGVAVQGDLPLAELLVGTCLYLILKDRGATSFQMFLDPEQQEWLKPFLGSSCFISQCQMWFDDSQGDLGWYSERRILLTIDSDSVCFRAADKSLIKELSIMRIPVRTREIAR